MITSRAINSTAKCTNSMHGSLSSNLAKMAKAREVVRDDQNANKRKNARMERESMKLLQEKDNPTSKSTIIINPPIIHYA